MQTMLKDAKSAQIPAQYVLFDTWFCSPTSLIETKSIGYDVIAKVKKADTIHFRYNGIMQSAQAIFRTSKKRRGTSNYLLSVEAEAVKDGQSIPVKLVFVRNRNTLVDDRDGLFGDEAINTIVQEMENNRDDTIVIFAGYPDKMKKFLAKNEGLKSRISFHLDFPDYNEDELLAILSLMASKKGYQLNQEVQEKCRHIFAAACQQEDFGNGRYARNLIEQALLRQAQRLMEESEGTTITRETLLQLKPEDFEAIENDTKEKKTGIGFACTAL